MLISRHSSCNYSNMQSRVLFLLFCSSLASSCLQETRIKKYIKIKTCRRSEANLISRTTLNSLKDCASYARERNALAFNYAPPKEFRKRRRKVMNNCHALGCPELNNFTSLIKDTKFDYYSLYGNETVLQNSTCIKNIGVFRLMLEKRTYAEAMEQCQMIFGDLAHVVSELRTNALANLLITLQDWYKAAYVGLDDRAIEGRFQTPLGDAINCYKYRAWSPGHPRNALRSDDCVILDSDKTWKVVNCKTQLAFICELYPTEKSHNNYLHIDCDVLHESSERHLCRKNKRLKKGRRMRRRCNEDE